MKTPKAARTHTINGAVKRLADIKLTELHTLKNRDIINIVKVLPIVLQQVNSEINRRKPIAPLL